MLNSKDDESVQHTAIKLEWNDSTGISANQLHIGVRGDHDCATFMKQIVHQLHAIVSEHYPGLKFKSHILCPRCDDTILPILMIILVFQTDAFMKPNYIQQNCPC